MTVNEYRVYGPPGTGKTTYLVEQIKKCAAEYGCENIMAASFSKTAAAELVGRKTELGKKQIGTLHSHCYNLLGNNVQIAEKNCEEWNRQYPVYLLGRNSNSIDDAIEQQYDTEGERLLSQLNILRGKMVSVSEYPADVFDFYQKWVKYKNENGYFDFCDLIETAYYSHYHPPYTIGFFDEAQDFTPLELALIRRWSEQMHFIVLAGDDDQCIYGFKSKFSWTIPTFLNVSRTVGTRRSVVSWPGFLGLSPSMNMGLDVAPSPRWQDAQPRYSAELWQAEQETISPWSACAVLAFSVFSVPGAWHFTQDGLSETARLSLCAPELA